METGSHHTEMRQNIEWMHKIVKYIEIPKEPLMLAYVFVSLLTLASPDAMEKREEDIILVLERLSLHIDLPLDGNDYSTSMQKCMSVTLDILEVLDFGRVTLAAKIRNSQLY